MPMPLSGLAQTLSNSVARVQAEIVDVQEQLASGTKKLNPAENGVVTRLSAQAVAYGVVLNNISTAQNVISVNQTALGSIADILTQMKSIATQSASSGLQASDTSSLNATFQQLATQVYSIQQGASVNGNNLLLGSNLTVQTGIEGNSASQTTLNGVDVTSLYNAIKSLNVSDVVTDALGSYVPKQTQIAPSTLASTKVFTLSDGTATITFTNTSGGTLTANQVSTQLANYLNNGTLSTYGSIATTGSTLASVQAKISGASVDGTGQLIINGSSTLYSPASFTATNDSNAITPTTTAAVNQKDVVTFSSALKSGDTVTMGGLTFTASTAVTTSQLASVFAWAMTGTNATNDATHVLAYGTLSGAVASNLYSNIGTYTATQGTGTATNTLNVLYVNAGAQSTNFQNSISSSLGTSAYVNSQSAITTLTAQLQTVSTSQSVLSAQATGLASQTKASQALKQGLTDTVGTIQNIDATAMQAKLQQLNNQQSIDYYLVSQMNTEAAAILSIFR